MVRLTADLIFSSSHHFNAVRERELDLRGNKISAIENLGATEDNFDSLDLSDNEIVKLEGFPMLKRLTTLLLSNNRIMRISTSVGAQLPNLRTLVLCNNRLNNLSDLDPLAYLRRLETLALLDNLVAKKPKYRLYVANLMPKLRLLDFKKISQKERKEAKAVFRKAEVKSAEAETGKTFVPGEALEELTPKAPQGQTEARAEAVAGAGAGAGGEAEAGAAGGTARVENVGEAGNDERGGGHEVGPPQADGDTNMEDAEREETVAKAGPTPEQLTAIKAAIATAKTLEEVARLEKALKSGRVTVGLPGLAGEVGH